MRTLFTGTELHTLVSVLASQQYYIKYILVRDLPSMVCCYSHNHNLLLLNAFFRVFPVLWKIAKIFVDPKTRAKCVVLKNSELHKLCDYFDPEDLPEEFGGTCRCESGCLPPVPKHMVSLTFQKKFNFPSDEHGRWYNLRAFACNLRARHGGTVGDISEPVQVWI